VTSSGFGSAWRRARLTADDRAARGKRARAESPRSAHGAWAAPPDRPDPIDLLAGQARDRVSELVPIRHGRMLESAFAFFRGGALIMAADLAHTPNAGMTVQLCGDAHLSNFGVFGTPERQLVFDVNDFDETLPGPWEWDVKRLAASFEVAGRDRGFASADRRTIVTTAVAAYREQMRRAAAMKTLETWYDHLEVGVILDELRAEQRARRLRKRDVRTVERNVAKARTRDSVRVLAKRTTTASGALRIVADPPLVTPIEELVAPGSEWEDSERVIKGLLSSYVRTMTHDRHPVEEFRYVHAARKVVGVGSVGTRCFIVLLVGRDDDDPLFLQVKEAQPSVLERFLGSSEYENNGERVVVGQRLMQAASDIFLGWQRITGPDGATNDYYVRQFEDWKGGVDVDALDVASSASYARLCGSTLARAHARWGDRIAIASYLGKGDAFDQAIADFAASYADQNQRDYESLVAAVECGRLPATLGH
jgi:uncharacterized protein (DUF2252 family)